MQPETEADLVAAIRDSTGPLCITGGGTRRHGAAIGPPLHVTGLQGIVHYDPAALTLVARAGTPLDEVTATLAAHGQHLAFEPPGWRTLLGRTGTSTLGGVIAANASGPRRVQVGAARDFVLGVRFVDGRGTLIRNGGRVMKNVTGYDLARLLAGSHGTLGVLTEVALKVLPRPPITTTLQLEGLTPTIAMAAMAAALGSPFEVSGAAHQLGGPTWLRIEGLPVAVHERTAGLQLLLAEFGRVTTITDPATNTNIWAAVRDVTPLAGSVGALWRLSVRPSAMTGLLARAGATAALLDWGGARAWLRCPDGVDLRARLGPFEGHAIRLTGHGGPTGPVEAPESPAVAALTRALRARFDPAGRFTPAITG